MNRPLRIVAAIRQFAPAVGGAQNLLIDVLAAVRQQGHDTSVVTFDAGNVPDLRGHGAGLPAREHRDGVTVYRVAPDGGVGGRVVTQIARHPFGGQLLKRTTGFDVPYWGDRPSILGMSMTLARIPADLFLSIGWFSKHAPVMDGIARARGIPVIGVPCFHLAQRSAYWPRHRWLARSCAAVVTLSAPEADHARVLGARSVLTIPPTLPAGYAAAANAMNWRTARGIPASAPIVAFVGRQVARKGCPHLVRAMRHVWTTHPEARLLLARRIRNRDEVTARMVHGLTPDERARVIEEHDFTDTDTASIMSAASMLVMPSTDEAFGIVYLEAWACGRPVIAADIPSTRWLAGDSGSALLVAPDDDEALASAIRRLLDSPRYADTLGARGRDMVTSRFPRAAFAEQWAALIGRLHGDGAGSGGPQVAVPSSLPR